MSRKKVDLLKLFNVLLRAYGPQDWWPGEDDPFEVIVGAILTQRTTWANAAKAIETLRLADVLDPGCMRAADVRELESLIRSAGFHTAKARTLKTFCELLFSEYRGDLDHILRVPMAALREILLSVPGIGDETADAILVYAAGQPSFVIDAYTQRVLERLGWIGGGESYLELQAMFCRSLPIDVDLFAEYHALIVQHGKKHCRKKPLCDLCPLRVQCAFSQHARGQR